VEVTRQQNNFDVMLRHCEAVPCCARQTDGHFKQHIPGTPKPAYCRIKRFTVRTNDK